MTKEVVGSFDAALMTKANKTDILTIENKFRIFTPVKAFEDFKIDVEQKFGGLESRTQASLETTEQMTKYLPAEIK